MMMKPFQSRGCRAFGLLELIAVVAVLGVLLYLAFPVFSGGRMAANRAKCAGNMRQIGTAMLLYAADHNGGLPVTSHTTGNSRRKVNGEWVYNIEQSWIYTLGSYLADVDEVRVCPADEEERRARILELKGTSYLLNDLIFDSEEIRRVQQVTRPARTIIAFISSRAISKTWDHAHCGDWASWDAMLDDVSPDRHRQGKQDPQRLSGSANYLYADGRVETLTAKEWKGVVESGEHPWVP